MTLKARDGSIIGREVYTYERDGVGNWTKMTTSLVLFEDGKLRYEPVELPIGRLPTFMMKQSRRCSTPDQHLQIQKWLCALVDKAAVRCSRASREEVC